MTRINDALLVQRVDDDLVLLNESTGAEVLIEERRRAAFFRVVQAATSFGREHPDREYRDEVGPTLHVVADAGRLEVRCLKTGEEVAVAEPDWDALTAALQYLTRNDFDLTDEA